MRFMSDWPSSYRHEFILSLVDESLGFDTQCSVFLIFDRDVYYLSFTSSVEYIRLSFSCFSTGFVQRVQCKNQALYNTSRYGRTVTRSNAGLVYWACSCSAFYWEPKPKKLHPANHRENNKMNQSELETKPFWCKRCIGLVSVSNWWSTMSLLWLINKFLF